jgi:predicted phosphodiesterase
MRIAIVSDIHGNRTAFEAVLADLKQTSPDLILHGGDLADSGASPSEIVDRIRELGWAGVVGNTDEMLFAPSRCRNSRNNRPDCSLLLRW